MRRRQIVAAFNSKRDSVPAYNTVRRILADTVSESELQQSFRQYLHQSFGGQQSILVVLDELLSIAPANKFQSNP